MQHEGDQAAASNKNALSRLLS